jgi:hypothetical protein
MVCHQFSVQGTKEFPRNEKMRKSDIALRVEAQKANER